MHISEKELLTLIELTRHVWLTMRCKRGRGEGIEGEGEGEREYMTRTIIIGL